MKNDENKLKIEGMEMKSQIIIFLIEFVGNKISQYEKDRICEFVINKAIIFVKIFVKKRRGAYEHMKMRDWNGGGMDG